MTTRPEITAILNWQRQHVGQVRYSETASTRLAFDGAHLTSATDCSGMAIRMLKHFGGTGMRDLLADCTYTGNLCTVGEHITNHHAAAASGQGMLPGDLIFFTWNGHNPAYDHVAIYAGNGRIWNHGGPGNGPLDWSLRDNVNAAAKVMVRRYLAPAAPKPPQSDDLLEWIMSLPGAPKGLTYQQLMADIQHYAGVGVLSNTSQRNELGKKATIAAHIGNGHNRVARIEENLAKVMKKLGVH